MTNRIGVRDYSMGLALLAIWAFFFVANSNFLAPRNFSMLMIEMSINAILALGMLLIIVSGQIDLSVGSGLGLVGGIASVLVFQHSWPAGMAMLTATLAGLAIWTFMGALIAYQRIPAFIITLGGLLIFKGAFWKVIGNATIPVVAGGQSNLYSLLTTYYFPPAGGVVLGAVVAGVVGFSSWRARCRRQARGLGVEDFEPWFLKIVVFAQAVLLLVIMLNQFRGVPLPFALLVLLSFVVHFLSRNTPFGRYLYATGGNEEAARISGIPTNRIIVGAYALMGLFVALSGFLQTAYAGASTTTLGELMELDAIAACVIGGASLRGGRGTVLGVLFGALIMASLLNGMTLLAVSPEIKYIARGSALALAVWLDIRLAKS
ncbi:MAG: hypothetical protein K1X53_16980 [Candidatus Sumerlaeaceae bacterium]|nr:hypothetical protein [Candidatus Sumerlaeaceae bacterium]